MKNLLVIIAFAFAAGGAFAQQQPATVQMQCRDMSATGNFIYPGETIVNGMACHTVQTAPTAAPVASPSAVTAQSSVSAPAIVPEANTVFIAPMNGFETYLAAAIAKKKVPLTVVIDEAHAAYLIRGTSEEKKAGWAKMAFTGSIHSDDAASVQMIDRASGAVVFAYAVNKKNTWHGKQTTAEACAKHLREQLEKK